MEDPVTITTKTNRNGSIRRTWSDNGFMSVPPLICNADYLTDHLTIAVQVQVCDDPGHVMAPLQAMAFMSVQSPAVLLRQLHIFVFGSHEKPDDWSGTVVIPPGGICRMPRSCTPPESLVPVCVSCIVVDGSWGSAATTPTPLTDNPMSIPIAAIMLHNFSDTL